MKSVSFIPFTKMIFRVVFIIWILLDFFFGLLGFPLPLLLGLPLPIYSIIYSIQTVYVILHLLFYVTVITLIVSIIEIEFLVEFLFEYLVLGKLLLKII